MVEHLLRNHCGRERGRIGPDSRWLEIDVIEHGRRRIWCWCGEYFWGELLWVCHLENHGGLHAHVLELQLGVSE